jgi:hypothetical protein
LAVINSNNNTNAPPPQKHQWNCCCCAVVENRTNKRHTWNVGWARTMSFLVPNSCSVEAHPLFDTCLTTTTVMQTTSIADHIWAKTILLELQIQTARKVGLGMISKLRNVCGSANTGSCSRLHSQGDSCLFGLDSILHGTHLAHQKLGLPIGFSC